MKKCPKCGLTKDSSMFNKNKSRGDGLSSCCKECNKSYLKSHYAKNYSYYKDKTRKYRDEGRKFIYEYLSGKCCSKCGYNKSVFSLQFHHLGNKLYNISEMPSIGQSINSIQKEIDKCIILCANCHYEITGNQFGRYDNI